MATRARVETKATWDDADLVAGTKRSEEHAKTFAGRIQNLFGGGIFRGERRVARSGAFFATELGQAQTLADAATASVQGLAGAFRIGFVPTVAAVAGLAIFKKFQDGATASEKAYKALQEETNRPLGFQAQLDTSGLTKEIDATKAARDKAFEESRNFANREKSGALHALDKITGGSRGESFDESLLRPIDEADAKLDKLGKARGDAALREAGAMEETLKVSERLGSVDKVRSEYAAKRAAIKLEGVDPGTASRLKALSQQEELAVEAVHQKFDIQGRQLAVEQDLANLAASGASAQAQAIQAEQDHLGLVQDELSFNKQLTDEKLQQLEVDRTRATTALRNAQYAGADMRTEAVEARNQAQLENLRRQAFETNVKQAEAGGGTGQAYGAVMSGVGKVGPLDSGPSTAGGGESFNKFFHKELIDAVKQIPAKLDEHLGNADFMEVK